MTDAVFSKLTDFARTEKPYPGKTFQQNLKTKFGFKNINRKEYVPLNIDTIQILIEQKKIKKQLKIENIIELNLASKGDLVKVLGRGKIGSPVEVYAHKFSKSAKESIEKAGGKVINL